MSSQTQQASTKTEYFNLTIKGMGYLSNIRQWPEWHLYQLCRQWTLRSYR
jgi:hypothetical protein